MVTEEISYIPFNMANEQPPPTPTSTADAIRKAVLQLYCCEDIDVIGKLGSGFYANVYLV